MSAAEIRKESKRRRDWGALAMSLLLAFTVWILHELSLDYTTYMQYRIIASTDLEGHAGEASANEMLTVRGKARGFYILSQHLSRGHASEVRIDIDGPLLTPVQGSEDLYRVKTVDIREKFSEAIGSGFDIDYVESQSLSFFFPSQGYVKVPVAVTADITYAKQYMKVGEIALSPDSVTIYGKVSALKNISQVRTRRISYASLDKSIQGVVELDLPAGLTVPHREIAYSIAVSRYVEKSANVPVALVNVPDDKNVVVLPSQVKVTWRAPFLAGGAPAKVPELVIDYEKLAHQRGTKAIPELAEGEDSVFSMELSPAMVECIITDKEQ